MHLCSYNSLLVASLNKRTCIAEIWLGRKDLWCLLLAKGGDNLAASQQILLLSPEG